MARSLADLEARPTHVMAKELMAVLEEHGWRLGGGTRHGTIAERKGVTLLVPGAHEGFLLPLSVRRIVKMIRATQ